MGNRTDFLGERRAVQLERIHDRVKLARYAIREGLISP